MAGYTRQSVADIIANAVIKAAPVNAEYNAIRDAFNASTGHNCKREYIEMLDKISLCNSRQIRSFDNPLFF